MSDQVAWRGARDSRDVELELPIPMRIRPRLTGSGPLKWSMTRRARTKDRTASDKSGTRADQILGSWPSNSAERKASTVSVSGLSDETAASQSGMCLRGTSAELVKSRGMFTTWTKLAIVSGARALKAITQESPAKLHAKKEIASNAPMNGTTEIAKRAPRRAARPRITSA